MTYAPGPVQRRRVLASPPPEGDHLTTEDGDYITTEDGDILNWE